MGTLKEDISSCNLWGEHILIFVCVGSREYQFNRLLEKIDELIEQKAITEDVFAQIGQSSYLPKNYKSKRFLSADEFKLNQERADLIISHGGTGALLSSLKLGKQVLAVPRLAKYGEHIDDHQTEVAGLLAEEGYLRCVLDMEDLLEGIESFKTRPITKKYEKPSMIIEIVKDYINSH